MMGEKYILDCPKCGRVAGYAPWFFEEDSSAVGDPEDMIEERAFETPTGPAIRVCCPTCGSWIRPDRSISA